MRLFYAKAAKTIKPLKDLKQIRDKNSLQAGQKWWLSFLGT